jgi:hypothetical protein
MGSVRLGKFQADRKEISMKPCMGGFCRIRESCWHYNAPDKANPAERLCIPGRDGMRRPLEIPVRVIAVQRVPA